MHLSNTRERREGLCCVAHRAGLGFYNVPLDLVPYQMCTGQQLLDQQAGALSSSCARAFAVATELVMDIGTRASSLTLSNEIKAGAVPTLTAAGP